MALKYGLGSGLQLCAVHARVATVVLHMTTCVALPNHWPYKLGPMESFSDRELERAIICGKFPEDLQDDGDLLKSFRLS